MPNLSFARIAATLVTLTACTKQAPAPDTIQRTTDLVSPSASVVAQPPPATATAAAGPKSDGTADASATERGKAKPGAIGSAAGQMSCGAGSCSGAGAAKKK